MCDANSGDGCHNIPIADKITVHHRRSLGVQSEDSPGSEELASAISDEARFTVADDVDRNLRLSLEKVRDRNLGIRAWVIEIEWKRTSYGRHQCCTHHTVLTDLGGGIDDAMSQAQPWGNVQVFWQVWTMLRALLGIIASVDL